MIYAHLTDCAVCLPKQALWLLLALFIFGGLIVAGSPAGFPTTPTGLTASEWHHLQSLIPPDLWIQTAQLNASDAAFNDRFGVAVAVDGDTVVVGAYFDDDSGTESGSAYVFVRPESGWLNTSEIAKLTASDAAALDWFGRTVDVDGDTIIVGAHSADNGANSDVGAAYVFVRPESGWVTTTETAKLTASDAALGDAFGWSVAIDGNTAIVGAYLANASGVSSGSAYLFVQPESGWITTTETAKLTASDSANGDDFGWSVAVDGDTVVVGAFLNRDKGIRSGSAYVFVRPGSGWATTTETTKLTPSDAANDDFFGYAVAVSGNTVVVGSYFDDDDGSGSGSVYVFVRPGGEWTTTSETAKLTASDAAADDFFGQSVAVYDDRIIVGALGDDDDGAFSGSAYVFIRPGTGWTTTTETGKLTASDASADDFFSGSVALDDATIVVGALGANAAYVFEDLLPTSISGTTVSVQDGSLLIPSLIVLGLGLLVLASYRLGAFR